MVSKRRHYEEGSALLIVFVFAAIVALMLYRALPDVVFEAQRQKEQLLIDRGNEYKLAIRRFYAKNSRYPTAMEQLDKFNNVRYLRRHYKDPMTGKEEWRLIHIQGPGFVLTDSKVTPLKANQQQNANSSFGSSNTGGFGNTQNAGGFGTPSSNSGGFGANTSEPSNQENANNATTGGNNGNPPEPTAAQLYGAQRRPPPIQQVQGQPSASQPGIAEPVGDDTSGAELAGDDDGPAAPQPTANTAAQTAVAPAPIAPGVVAGMPVTDPNLANPNNPTPTNPNTNNPNSTNPNAANPNSTNPADPALNAVSNSLRRPNAVPTPNRQPQQQPAGPTILNGSIAGVASTATGSSIKVIDKQTDYSKWEFVFNPQKDAANGMQNALNNMGGNNQSGTKNQSIWGSNPTPNSNTGTNPSSSFGANSNTTPQN